MQRPAGSNGGISPGDLLSKRDCVVPRPAHGGARMWDGAGIASDACWLQSRAEWGLVSLLISNVRRRRHLIVNDREVFSCNYFTQDVS